MNLITLFQSEPTLPNEVKRPMKQVLVYSTGDMEYMTIALETWDGNYIIRKANKFDIAFLDRLWSLPFTKEQIEREYKLVEITKAGISWMNSRYKYVHLRELAPHDFQFGNYGGCIPTDKYISHVNEFVEWLRTQTIIGYNKKPYIRPDPDQTAIMFIQDGREAWSHVPNKVFKSFIDTSYTWNGETIKWDY